MTKREAAIVSAYTGKLIGGFSDLHAYIEEKLGHPVMTHQLVDPKINARIKEEAKKDFIVIEVLK